MFSQLQNRVIHYCLGEAKVYQAILLFVIAIALIGRLYRLDSAPPGISGDELFNAVDASLIGKGFWPVYLEGNYGREALFFYLMAVSLRLFGQTIFAIRLPAALLGTGSIVLAYYIGRNSFKHRVGLLAAALMAVSLWPLMVSRWGLRAVSLTFCTALTIYLLDHALRHQQRRSWLLGGIALSLTMYTYIPSRAFPVVILAWFAWLLWSQREQARSRLGNMALSLLIAGLVFAPYGWYIRQNPDKVNQRIHTLGVALNQALAGEPTALVEPITGVLQMFTIHGDREWRYHLSGRPIFDPVTGLFFYAGIMLCLWDAFSRRYGGKERPAYALLLLWMGAMLAPNAILEANSSFLRAAGAIVPVYLITAVGFDVVYSYIRQKWPQSGMQFWLPLLVVLGLVLTLWHTWHGYFTIWNNNSEVRQIYEADLVMIARYLEAHPPPPGTRVFIAHDYAFDAAPRNFAYSNQSPVAWFVPASNFAWSQTAEDTESWYFVPADESLPAEVVQRLSLSMAFTQVTYPDGEAAFLLYRWTPGSQVWRPQYQTALSFTDGPRLIGYDLPDTLYRGDTFTLYLHWQVPADQAPLPNQLTSTQVLLEDSSGNVWAKNSLLLGYPQINWLANDRFVQLLDLQIPSGMLPGAAYLRVDLHNSDGTLYTTLTPNRVGPLLVRSRPLADFTLEPDTLVLDHTLALQKASFSSLLVPGLPIDIALEWVALEAPAVDYRLELQLLRPGETNPFLKQVFTIWPDVYPPSRWQPGEPITSLHRFNIPLDIPTDVNPELRVQLLPPEGSDPLPITQGSNKLADMTLSLREHLFEPPSMSHTFKAQFGSSIQLLGYDMDVSQGQPGGQIQLTLYWQALETPPDHYTVFNHLITPDGQIAGQFDSPPVGDAWLTGSWLPGEIVIDLRTIPIQPDAVNGRYSLVIGLYTASDGERLPVSVNGRPQGGDQLILTELTVEP